jgi:hypothetical protein
LTSVRAETDEASLQEFIEFPEEFIEEKKGR